MITFFCVISIIIWAQNNYKVWKAKTNLYLSIRKMDVIIKYTQFMYSIYYTVCDFIFMFRINGIGSEERCEDDVYTRIFYTCNKYQTKK